MTETCYKCGSDRGTVTFAAGHMIAWDCDACGSENGYTFSPAVRSPEELKAFDPEFPEIGSQINGDRP